MYKLLIFIIFIIYALSISLNDINLLKNFQDLNDSDLYIFNILRSIIVYILGEDDSFLDNLELSEQCYDKMTKSFFQYHMTISVDSFPYYQKLFLDSSRNKNDLTSYSDCIEDIKVDHDINKKVNFTYLTVLIDSKNSLYDMLTKKSGVSEFLIGLCFIDDCEIEDYKKIIKKAMNYLNITRDSSLNETENKDRIHTRIKIYRMNDSAKAKGFVKFLELLPFIIICLQIIFIIFNSIPMYVYRCLLYVFCCKTNKKILTTERLVKNRNTVNSKKNKNSGRPSANNQSNLSLVSINNNIIKSFELLFNITNNITALIEMKKQNEITNDGGLSYINGIKGIAMIFFLFGSVYSVLYSSLVTEQTGEIFYSHLNNIFFSIFYIGIKYAPKVLLCTSGFSLFFKFMCYLDGKLDTEKDLNTQIEESFNDSKDLKEMKNSSSSILSSNKKKKRHLNANYSISNKYIINFFILQLHKYILFLLFISLALYSLDWIVSSFGEYGPMWQFFYQSFISSARSLKFIIPLLIGYKSFIIPGISPEKDNILNYFYLVFQEIFYFLITTIIIFIGYKKNIRIYRFFKILFTSLIILRIIYYFCNAGLDDKDYFGYHEYGRFYTSMIYNYSFYIIGIQYGMANYIIQKGYSVKDAYNLNKNYLVTTLNVLTPVNKKNKKLILIVIIISSILLVFNIFIQQIIIYGIKFFKSSNLHKNMEIYKKDFLSQLIMLFDSDIFVLALNALALSIYLKGDNLLNNILCHGIWSVFNRFYFSYILLINPIILYLLYNIETKIIFNMANCILYSFICGIFVYLITMIIYVSFELPFKKIIRFVFNLKEKRWGKERLSNVEATYSYCQNDNSFGSATASITDYNEEEEDEDEY